MINLSVQKSVQKEVEKGVKTLKLSKHTLAHTKHMPC